MPPSTARDAIGRRLWKYVTQNGVTTSTAWLSVGDREMAEYEGVGTATLKTRFVYGAGIDETLAQVDANGAVAYVFSDALGSTIALTNASGQLTEKHAYTAYGLETIADPGHAAFRFAGRRLDPETGLYHNRARAYSPALGRFLQTNPIGTSDNINLYAYVGNDPLNRVDPTGEVGQLANGVAVRANAVVNGAYSVLPGVGNFGDVLIRGTGLAGNEEFKDFNQEARFIDNAIAYAATHPSQCTRRELSLLRLNHSCRTTLQGEQHSVSSRVWDQWLSSVIRRRP